MGASDTKSQVKSALPEIRPPITRKAIWGWVVVLFGAAGAALAAAAVVGRERAATTSAVRVVSEHPHDPEAFTQGLVFHAGKLYEGTGLEGKSTLRRVDLTTGRVEARHDLADTYFGEGIAILDGRIYQLTWRNRVAIVYDLETMQFLKTVRYSGEGWGLTTDGRRLILSDGSSTLKVVNPATFDVVERIPVTDRKRPVSNLNELEYIDGEIWANIWHSDRIARISPETGQVVGWIDLGALYPASKRPSREHVLNGIAYDAEEKRIFVTGKNWPKLFEIEMVPRRIGEGAAGGRLGLKP
jgi:glutamine cyclotransferase